MTDKTTKRVLIVDDSEQMRTVMVHYLKEAGYEALTAENGKDCLEKVVAISPDVILLDVMMPGIHGFEVLKQLKLNPDTSSIGVIMCSAKDYKAEKDIAAKLGAFTYLTKPFTYHDLVTVVDECYHQVRLSQPQPTELKQSNPGFEEKESGSSKPYIRFWGTRGSTPVSGKSYMKYGGNTPCLEVNDGKTMVIIDAGPGIRELGIRLMNEPPRPIHLFIGHTHWDHIQGFPFFNPLFNREASLTVYGVPGFGKDIRSIFSGQLDADYFPVQLPDLSSSLHFHQLKENPFTAGSVQVFWAYVYHPGSAIGFKFSLGGKTIVYMTDNEFLKGYIGTPDVNLVNPEILGMYNSLISFIKNADILIAESQYTDEEYGKKIGWGHTTLSNGALLCKICNVKQWIVTHHDPMHTDEFLDRKLLRTREVLASIDYAIPVSHAFDGLIEYF